MYKRNPPLILLEIFVSCGEQCDSFKGQWEVACLVQSPLVLLFKVSFTVNIRSCYVVIHGTLLQFHQPCFHLLRGQIQNPFKLAPHFLKPCKKNILSHSLNYINLVSFFTNTSALVKKLLKTARCLFQANHIYVPIFYTFVSRKKNVNTNPKFATALCICGVPCSTLTSMAVKPGMSNQLLIFLHNLR